MSPAKLETVFLVAWPDDMDDSARVLLLVQALQYQEVAVRTLVIHQVVGTVLCPQHQRVRLLADFALKCLPIVGRERRTQLALLFHVYPAAETFEVDVTYRTGTLARGKERVVRVCS